MTPIGEIEVLATGLGTEIQWKYVPIDKCARVRGIAAVLRGGGSKALTNARGPS